jgi:hypothetical protein
MIKASNLLFQQINQIILPLQGVKEQLSLRALYLKKNVKLNFDLITHVTKKCIL